MATWQDWLGFLISILTLAVLRINFSGSHEHNTINLLFLVTCWILQNMDYQASSSIIHMLISYVFIFECNVLHSIFLFIHLLNLGTIPLTLYSYKELF